MKKMFFVLILVMASYLYAFNPNPVNPGENPITPGENPINPGENPINPGGHPINGNPIIPIEINPIIIGGELKMPCIAFINGWSCHQVPNRVCVKSSKGNTCVCRDGFKEDKYDYKHACVSLCHNVSCPQETQCKVIKDSNACVNLQENNFSDNEGEVLLCGSSKIHQNNEEICYSYRGKDLKSISDLDINLKKVRLLDEDVMFQIVAVKDGDEKFVNLDKSHAVYNNPEDSIFYSLDEIYPDYNNFTENGSLYTYKFNIVPRYPSAYHKLYGDSSYISVDYYKYTYDYSNRLHRRFIEKEGYNNEIDKISSNLNIIKKIEADGFSIYDSNYKDIKNKIFDDIAVGEVFISKDNNLSNGLILCKNKNESNICTSLKYHVYSYEGLDDDGKKTGIFFKSNNLDEDFEKLNELTDIYLHEGWEALACPKVDSSLKDCKKIKNNTSYEAWSEIGLSSAPEFIVVQTKNKSNSWNDVIIYDDYDFKGNAIVYQKFNERYPLPIKRVRSIYKQRKSMSVYLSKKDIRKFNETNINLYDKNSDKFTNKTTSAAWFFDKPNAKLNSIFLENTKPKEGLKITYTDNDEYYYHKNIKKTIYVNNIKGFEVLDGWEIFVCKDDQNNDCKYFSSGVHLNKLKTYLGSSSIKSIFIQPSNHQKIEEFYGYEESDHNDYKYNNKGYIILYKNTNFKKEFTYLTFENFSMVAKKALGQAEIVWIKDNIINIGQDTLTKPEEVKAIQIVSPLKVELHGAFKRRKEKKLWFDNSLGEIENLESVIPKTKYISSFNADKSYFSFDKTIEINHVDKIKFLEPTPSVAIFDSQDFPAIGLGWGVYTQAQKEDIITQFYSSRSGNDSQVSWYLNVLGFFDKTLSHIPKEAIDKKLDSFREDLDQNMDVDGADMLFIVAHGGWDSDQYSSQSVLGKGNGYFNNKEKDSNSEYNAYGGLGDHNLEWFLTSACESLGDAGVNNKEAIDSYKDYFFNGLHGVGGMYKTSVWVPFSSNAFKRMGRSFIENLKKYSVAKAWVGTFYYSLFRWAGYLSPGSCDSYSKNDYFHGYGTTLEDPDRAFILENGFCYYSGYSDSYFYNFSQIVANSDTSQWDILIGSDQENTNDIISNDITTYFNLENQDDIHSDDNSIEYDNKNDDEFIELDNISDTLQPKFAAETYLVESIFKGVVLGIYNSIFKDVIEKHDYHIKDISITYMSRQHYDFNGNIDKRAEVNEIVFRFNIAHNNHLFIDNNYFIIGINPATLEVTRIKSKILSLKKKSQITADIDSKLNEYKINDKANSDNYVSTYIKKGDVFIPAIMKKEENKNTPVILDIYEEEE